MERMFVKFYKTQQDDVEKLAAEFSDAILKHKRDISPAQVQGFFMFYKNDPESALNNVAKIWDQS